MAQAQAPTFADWLARGREHQWQGRPIDAIPCFERAARLEPRAGDAPFHLGEVRWQLGMVSEAIDAWREAVRRAPEHLAPRLALAEALLFVGDDRGAHDASERALALAPGNPRALAMRAVSRFDGETPSIDGNEVTTLATRDVAPFIAPAIGRALARRWRPGIDAERALSQTLAPHVEQLPWQLVVALARQRACPDCRDEALRASLEREIVAEDIDALRELALAAFEAGAHDRAQALALRYAGHCIAMFTPPFPPVWPLRGAGERVRVAVVAGSRQLDALDRLRRARHDWDSRLEWVLWILGDAQAVPDPWSGAVHRWTAPVDLHLAQAIAADDPDLLIDAAGLRLPLGPLIAHGPARAFLSIAVPPFPLGPVTTAADALSLSESRLSEWIARFCAGIAGGSSSPMGASELRAQWEDAVRTHQAGHAKAAREAYEAFLAHQPDYAPAHFLLGVLLRDAGDRDAAIGEFERALAASPEYREARIAAMRLAAAMGNRDSLERYASITSDGTAHRDPVLLRTLGEGYLALSDYTSGGQALRRALELAPADPDMHYNVGVAAQMRRDLDEAARAYQRALVLQPGHIAAHFNIAVLFEEQGRLAPARSAYENVLARDPGRAPAYRNLGELLLRQGELDAYLANFARFEAACPDSLVLAVQALEACHLRADFSAAERYLEGLRNDRFKAADEVELVDCLEQLLYLVLFFDVEPAMVLRLAHMYDAAAPRVYGSPLPIGPRAPGRIRIGYLSGDLRDHVMGKMMWQALSRHDRDRFELHFFSTSPVRDDWTARFQDIGHSYVDVSALREREAAERIRGADLDLLVDLSTHTRGAKPGILALKPARVQVTHVASAGTLGLSTVDYKLTDRFADVRESEAQQIEPFLVMDGCVYPFRHVEPASPHPFERAAFGIGPRDVVIAAFVQPMKLSRRCLALWREILVRIPRARLAFSPNHPSLRDAFARLAAAAGIPGERIFFVPQGRNESENQSRYAMVDFVLDPMPFGGVNGVIEPLDMGVPVVSLVGRRHGERSAYSILANLGVTETIAQGGGEYIDIAVRLAGDAAFMHSVRTKIREALRASPLTDMDAHARHLEDAYLRALAAKAPEALDPPALSRSPR